MLVPFFNIIGLHLGNTLVLGLILCYIIVTALAFDVLYIRVTWLPQMCIVLLCILILMLSESHSVLNLNQTNAYAVRFFGLFLIILLINICYYNAEEVSQKIINPILKFYIVIFSFSIFIDFYILHSSLDISLQPMYSPEDWSYFGRPFGITGQPSVNSVLLVFFYTYLLSRTSFKSSYVSFFLMFGGVLLQGSGSGYIACLLLFFIMLRQTHLFIQASAGSILVFIVILLIENFKAFEKISLFYITGMIGVFSAQLFEWFDLLRMRMPTMSVLFGGVPSNIDFGPLFFVSNVGIIYAVIFIFLIVLCIIAARNAYQRFAIYILLVGNLHYPVMFYVLMAFFLPIVIQQSLFYGRKHRSNIS